MDANLKQQLKAIRIVYTSITIGVLVFLLVSIYINQLSGGFIRDDEFMKKLFLIVSNIFSISSITVGIIMFNKRIKEIVSHDLNKKINKYRDAMIIRAATIEASCFFFIVCFFIFGSILFLIEAILVLLILAYLFPTNYRIAKELNLDITEFN